MRRQCWSSGNGNSDWSTSWSANAVNVRSSIGTGRTWCIGNLTLVVVLMSGFLIGCSKPVGILEIDPRLTVPCERPALRGPTNRDYWIWGIEQAAAIEDCADRMDDIRGLSR